MASVTTMVRVSNATYDVVTSPMVMAMLWKRLNDIGKNWRHVYKGLLLLDYLLKTGAEHVVIEVRENKFALQSLLDFRYVDSRGVDKGINVREQAKNTLALIDDEAALAKERKACMQRQHQLTESLGRKAKPKQVQNSRAEKFAARANVMPNGEVAPDLREQEAQAVRNAQIQSYNEFAMSPSGQQAMIDSQVYNPPSNETEPGGVSNGTMTEEEALAYALHMSTIEAGSGNASNYAEHIAQEASGSRNPFTSPSTTHTAEAQSHEQMSAREEEELALALSLSLSEVQGVNQILNSDDESDAEPTPPNSPYQGAHFQQASHSVGSSSSGYLEVEPPLGIPIGMGPAADELPSYDESLEELAPGTVRYDTLHSEAGLMGQYLQQHSEQQIEDLSTSGPADDDSDEEL